MAGVLKTTAGYIGGHSPNPTYEAVCSGVTGHAEAVQIVFDPSRITFRDLLETFWRNMDPTAVDRQFFDIGTQYRTAIFYHSQEQRNEAEESLQALQTSQRFEKPIATQIVPATTFYPAEEYHQDYYRKCPLPYQRYKQGSGREAFLKKYWE
jgi:methionine-S-sulfoxide reductase